MKTKFTFIDPGAVIGVVTTLIVLGVGVFAFFIASQQMYNSYPAPAADTPANVTRDTYWRTVNNSSTTSTQVFNILGVVIIIGAIMSIIGLVYNYMR